jgi:hypothetical protein
LKTKELMLSTSTTSSTIKNVQSCVPPYFKMKSKACISYRYTFTIASKLFNYKQTLQCLDIEQLRQNPPTCSCSFSPFNYSPVGHIITGV